MTATTEQRALKAAKANADPIPIEDAIWLKYRVKIEIVEFDDDPSGYAWIAYHTPDNTAPPLFLNLPDKLSPGSTSAWRVGLNRASRSPTNSPPSSRRSPPCAGWRPRSLSAPLVPRAPNNSPASRENR